MDIIKKLKIKKQDGTYTDYIPIGAEAENVNMINNYSLQSTIGTIDVENNGSIAEQLDSIKYKEAIFNPDNYKGTELEKLQIATDEAIAYMTKTGRTAVIELNKTYDFAANDTLVINKPNNGKLLRFLGLNGGGFRLIANKTSDNPNILSLGTNINIISEIDFVGVTFYGYEKIGTLFHSPSFINVFFLNCTFIQWPQICVTQTYIQNVHLINCNIRSGIGHLFEVGGVEGLFISQCTIEHRNSGYILHQLDNHNQTGPAYTYNVISNCNIDHCLIEGFDASVDSGIIKLEGGLTELCVITDNYFEDMHNYIQLNKYLDGKNGSFIFQRNRVFESKHNDYADAVITCNNTHYGTITFSENHISNIGCIDLKQGWNVSERNVIFNSNTLLGNNNFDSNNGQWAMDSQTERLPFNIPPLIPLATTNDHCQYRRTIPVVSNHDFTIYLKDFLDYNDNTEYSEYSIRNFLRLRNGQLTGHRYKIYNTTSYPAGFTSCFLSFGVPIFADDIVSVSWLGPIMDDISVSNHLRTILGAAGEDQCLRILLRNNTNASISITQPILEATVDFVGKLA